MFRLALLGAAHDLAQQIATRLRGATLHAEADPAACANYDAVVLMGPCSRRSIVQLFEAGRGVLQVAAPDLGPGHVEGLDELARSAGARFALVNPERYRPSRQLIREQLADKLGAAGLVRIHRWAPASHKRHGLALDLDLILWLIAAAPEVVYAVETTLPAGGHYVQVHLGFRGGGMALLDCTNRLPPGADYEAVSVIAFSGAAYADDQQNMHLLYRGGLPQALRACEGVRAHVALIQDFVDAVAAERDSGGAAAWHDVFAVDAAVRRSLQTRQAVSLEGKT
jgi:hypothetical protein